MNLRRGWIIGNEGSAGQEYRTRKDVFVDRVTPISKRHVIHSIRFFFHRFSAVWAVMENICERV